MTVGQTDILADILRQTLRHTNKTDKLLGR